MSYSSQGRSIYATFIDRKNLVEYTTQPKLTSLNFGVDMRQFASAFDFEIQFGPYDKVAIQSHDWVEFWFKNGDQKFQIGAGFIEDFVKKTSSAGNIFQGNGRDFLAQLMLFPFKTRTITSGTSYQNFLNLSLENTYLRSYLKFRNRSSRILDYGMFKGPMIIMDVATAPRAQAVQEYAETGQNLVYQDRLGRMVVYGRSFADENETDLTFNGYRDHNVMDMQVRQNFSKVYSEATVLFSGEENLNLGSIRKNVTASRLFKNTDPRVRGLNQPLYKVFSTQDLLDQAGAKSAIGRIDELAKAQIRKSNQNLSQVVIVSDSPYYQSSNGQQKPYEIGQIFRIKSDPYEIDADHKLASLHYAQGTDSLQVQLGFVEPDTLV